jgi:hypothetical protein
MHPLLPPRRHFRHFNSIRNGAHHPSLSNTVPLSLRPDFPPLRAIFNDLSTYETILLASIFSSDRIVNVTNVFVSTAVAKEHQGLGQGIFNTVVQCGTAISLAIAATVAHAGGVSVDASVQELLNGYHACFFLSIGILAPPIVGCLFLNSSRASYAGGVEQSNVTSDSEKVQS